MMPRSSPFTPKYPIFKAELDLGSAAERWTYVSRSGGGSPNFVMASLITRQASHFDSAASEMALGVVKEVLRLEASRKSIQAVALHSRCRNPSVFKKSVPKIG
jgi:hypothetical protein